MTGMRAAHIFVCVAAAAGVARFLLDSGNVPVHQGAISGSRDSTASYHTDVGD